MPSTRPDLAQRLGPPWLAWSLGVAGAALLASDGDAVIRLPGAAMLLAGTTLLAWRSYRNRNLFRHLLGSIPLPDKGENLLRDLPRAWEDLERENLRLRTEAEAEDQIRRHILANLRTGVLLLGRDRQIRLFNPTARAILGASSNLGEGEPLVSAFREPESLKNFQEAFTGTFREWDIKRNPRTVRIRAVPFPAPVGEEGPWVLVTLDDITHHEALETTRQKFISNASHELKTPVTGIRVAVENLMDGAQVLPEGESNLTIILRSLDRMVMLLDDISELSRIETGALRLDAKPLVLGTFLQEFLEGVQSLGTAKEVRIVADLDPAQAAHPFQADPQRLGQLLSNLVSNAVKFGPRDTEVVVAARVEAEAVAFSVIDHGPGISAQDQARIFERFFRSQATRGVPGTGLGLSIVKHLAVLMGGEVDLRSEPGQGATFTFRLPEAGQGD